MSRVRFLIVMFIALCLIDHAPILCQSIAYDYDQAGNRIERRVINLIRTRAQESKGFEAPIQETLGVLSLKIYPNPTKGLLEIVVDGAATEAENQINEAAIYSVEGRLILQASQTVGRLRFDLTKEPNGVYILRLTHNQSQKEFKIIKE